MNSSLLIVIGLLTTAVLITAAVNYAVRMWPVLFPNRLGYPRRDEDVQFTVYKPSVVASGSWEKLVAFAHLSTLPEGAEPTTKDPTVEVRERAAAYFSRGAGGMAARTVDARTAVPRHDVIAFRLDFDDLEVAQAEQRFVWKGEVHEEKFEFMAPPNMEGKVARGKLSVYAGWTLLADIELSIQVNTARSKAALGAPDTVKATPYRKVFISYSRKDRHIVDQVVTYSRATGDEFLRDITHLRSGQDWDPQLLRMIEEADIFQLFWSTNSMASPYVRREWEHALSLKRRDFIRPAYWENPFPEDAAQGLPPDELRKLNFYHLQVAKDVPSRVVSWAVPGHALGAAVLMVSIVANVLVLTNRGIVFDKSLLSDLSPSPTPSMSPTPEPGLTPQVSPTPTYYPTPAGTPIRHPTPQTTPRPTPQPTPTHRPTPLATPIATPLPTPQATPDFPDVRARLDNFAIEFQNAPGLLGYIVCYSNRRGQADDAESRCDRARNYLVTMRGIDPSRIVIINGGYRRVPTIDLIIVPPGVEPPKPSPDIDPSKVEPIRTPTPL